MLYDEAHLKQKLSLVKTFVLIVNETIAEKRYRIEIKGTQGMFDNYVTCIEKCALPLFNNRRRKKIKYKNIVEFKASNNRQIFKWLNLAQIISFIIECQPSFTIILIKELNKWMDVARFKN